MNTSLYRSVLRISLLVVAILLVFESGILFPITRELSEDVNVYLATVGSSVRANVPENELNTLSAAIAERQRELDLREREIAARDFNTDDSGETVTYIMAAILFILSVLMILNFILDWRRARETFNAK